MALQIRKGDTVQVIAGDDRGKVGRVLSVDREKSRIVVEKVNFVKRHTKPRKAGVQGGILEREAPIHLSNVMLYDPKAERGTRTGSGGAVGYHRPRPAAAKGRYHGGGTNRIHRSAAQASRRRPGK